MRKIERAFLFLMMGWLFMGANCSSLQKKLEADIWLVDPNDGSIYRNVGEDDVEYIYCTDRSAELFSCMHKDDVTKWTDVLNAKCEE